MAQERLDEARATVVVRWLSDGTLRVGDIGDLSAARAAEGAVWVDVLAPDADTLAQLQSAFGLHPLAVEDCLHFPQRVKVDLYPEAVFMVWAFPVRNGEPGNRFTEVDVFLGAGFLITSHRTRVAAIDWVAAQGAEALGRGAQWTLHAILDRGVDDLFPQVDALSDRLDEIEDALLSDPDDTDLQQLYAIKRELISIYRVVTGERDSLRSMARREQFISADAYMFFQDVGDHLARIVDSIDTYRDVASGAMDIYLSAVNNRLNDVMRRLTVVATIFMPLTFITGIFGMNLIGGMWPKPEANWGFALVIVAMVVIAGSMVVFFRRKRWM